MKGRLVTVEGGEGAGKSSVMGALQAALAGKGVEVLRTREPGGTEAGEAIRALLLDPARTLAAETELLLMFAARAQHVSEIIAPALARGAWVLSDRFTDASFAYQEAGRGIDGAIVAELERWAVGFVPDLTFLLDVTVEQGHARIASRDAPRDRIEAEHAEFFERVRAAYLRRAAADPRRFRVIDAGRPQSEVEQAVREALDAAWKAWA